jgi:hypothetical protein
MTPYAIIGIHGLNNKPPAATLAAWWRTSLVEGLTRNLAIAKPEIAFELVYWADVMHAKPYDNDPQPYVAAQGTGPLPRHAPSLKDAANDLKNTLDKMSTVLGTGDVLEAIKKRVAADLHGYHTDAKTRDELRRRVRTAIDAAHAKRHRILLLTHSMGSIVAFDVLAAMKPGADTPRIDHLVTFGSPLGLHAVKAAARAQGFAMQVPGNVQHWTNLADRRDHIALDARLETDYAANAAGVTVRDVYVRNGYVTPGGEANAHKVYGYLRAPEMSDLVLAFVENR